MRHYLDHASTSPARPEVVEAMLPWLGASADPGRVRAIARTAASPADLPPAEELVVQIGELLGLSGAELGYEEALALPDVRRIER